MRVRWAVTTSSPWAIKGEERGLNGDHLLLRTKYCRIATRALLLYLFVSPQTREATSASWKAHELPVELHRAVCVHMFSCVRVGACACVRVCACVCNTFNV